MTASRTDIALEAMPPSTARPYAEDEARWSALMGRAQAGDAAAYRQLLGELSSVVERYLRSRLGGHDFIEDCVQEALLAVHEARHTYDPRRNFRPWLFAIVRHKATDALRRAKVRGRHVAPDAEITESGIEGPEADLDSGRMLAALPEGLRQALTLTKIIGLSTVEAAQALKISESALKVRVHRATGKLRRMMESEVA
jgi:RNA polymerase sigma-70 factor (ECF subfamily)